MPDPETTLSTTSATEPIQAALFGDADIILLTGPIHDTPAQLYPEEQQYIKNAAQARVAEFSAGRHYAKKALSKLGINDFPIHVGDNRQPVWPKTIVGSISHCKNQVGVVVTHTKSYAGIGLDIETIKPLRYNISRHVCTKKDTQWLGQFSDKEHDLMLIVLFSLKEAIYKAVYQYRHIKLGFKDVTVVPNLGNNSAHAEFHNHPDITKHEQPMLLRFYIDAPHVYSSALILQL
jgi:phosphopantetheine--protein transferase-like protein